MSVSDVSDMALFNDEGYAAYIAEAKLCDPELLRGEFVDPSPDGSSPGVVAGDLRVQVHGFEALGGFWTEAPNPRLPPGETKMLWHLHYDLDFDPATNCPTFADGDPEASVESWLEGTDIHLTGMAWWTTTEKPRFKTLWISVRTKNPRGEHHIREHMERIQPPDDPQDWRWDDAFSLANVLPKEES